MASDPLNQHGFLSSAADDCHADASLAVDASLAATDANGRIKKRTKTGCMTCRKRRVKCGEEKPRCSNCVKCKKQCEYGSKKSTKDNMGAMHESCDPCFSSENCDIVSPEFQPLPLDAWQRLPCYLEKSHGRPSSQSLWTSQHSNIRAGRPQPMRRASDRSASCTQSFASRSSRGSQQYNNPPVHGCVCQLLRQILLGTGTPETTPGSPILTASDSLMTPSPATSSEYEDMDYFSTLPLPADLGDFTSEPLISNCQRGKTAPHAQHRANLPSRAKLEQLLSLLDQEERNQIEEASHTEGNTSCWDLPHDGSHHGWFHDLETSEPWR